MDRSTRLLEAIPMKDATASSCITTFFSEWIARFGLQEHITSDRGTCFTSWLWQSPAELLGTTAHRTTSYNPAANGMVEQTRRLLKVSFMARCNNDSWLPQLLWILFSLRTAIKYDLNVSTAKMVLGQPLVVPTEFFHPQESPESLKQLRRTVGKFTPCVPTHHREIKEYLPKHFQTLTHVFLRTDAHTPSLTRPYAGPSYP
ncbi:uncharacterized protein LOC143036098 [Oratosquilla oratoria]|uniref:uncharacterized protein LOC143036098 n=1 Tax=Oratosquilla oratoria TaxID=337810 RepID=UPI003F7629F5